MSRASMDAVGPSPAKKTRKPNWSEDETLLLVQQIHQRILIVNRKFSLFLSNQDKEKAWKEIADACTLPSL